MIIYTEPRYGRIYIYMIVYLLQVAIVSCTDNAPIQLVVVTFWRYEYVHRSFRLLVRLICEESLALFPRDFFPSAI